MRITLLPDKKKRLDTRVKRRTLCPSWNETFFFEGDMMVLGSQGDSVWSGKDSEDW